MNYRLKIKVLAFLAFHSAIAFSLNYTAYKAAKAPFINGLADDSCWHFTKWNYIKYDWSNGKDIISNSGFSGKFKTTWTTDRLYILAEITDDVLRDDRNVPTYQYWNDDCLEIFIDEDHKSDPHECGTIAFNAFSYHCAAYPLKASGGKTTFDDPNGIHNVVDYGKTCSGRLFNDNVTARVTKNGNIYTWEIEIKIFDNTFIEDGVNIPLRLTANKVMGLAMAYCDNDNGTRESFVGTEPNHNDFTGPYPCFKFTNEYGTLTLNDSILIDGTGETTVINPNDHSTHVEIFPNPVGDIMKIENLVLFEHVKAITIRNISGQTILIVKSINDKLNINVSNLQSGLFILEACGSIFSYKQKFIKK